MLSTLGGAVGIVANARVAWNARTVVIQWTDVGFFMESIFELPLDNMSA
jgi:hypothetical protein